MTPAGVEQLGYLPDRVRTETDVAHGSALPPIFVPILVTPLYGDAVRA
jgi:hypothetical protein